MADEQTPLIQVVRVTPRRPRYTHSTLRRFCTILLGVSLFAVLLCFFLPASWLPGSHRGSRHHHPFGPPHPPSWPTDRGLAYAQLQRILYETPSPHQLRADSSRYTSGPHLAGKNKSQAIWTQERWRDLGISSPEVVEYDVYLNYPRNHRLALLKLQPDETVVKHEPQKPQATIEYECSLEEDALPEDSTTTLPERIPTFHGYSASGNVTASYVYANFGTYEDFEALLAHGIELRGKIALVKYAKIFRGLKVKRAQDLGMIGVVIYTDPQEDGNMTIANGYEPYPKGPARNPSSVQRGSVQFLSFSPGDPTTPGRPSRGDTPREDPHKFIPSIPSLPISYVDAIPLLKALNGHGPNAHQFGPRWQGGGLYDQGIEYSIGPSPPDLVLNLVNDVTYNTTPIWNVIGVVNGSTSDEVIILGNHRDAWIAGGAADPNSGSAILNEVVHGLGEALRRGWKPLRTIVVASWDGEEYGLLGSTEWVEDYLPWLKGSAVAYINVDVACSGSLFSAKASPLLKRALRSSIEYLKASSLATAQLFESWDGRIPILGSGSDYTAFLDHAGIPSIDMGFDDGAGDPVNHYHSNYDSFHWMDTFVDPSWKYHQAVAQLWGLVVAKLSDTPVLALNTTEYAQDLSKYLTAIKVGTEHTPGHVSANSSHFESLAAAIADLESAAKAFDARAQALAVKIEAQPAWWRWEHRSALLRELQQVNAKYKLFERQFLHADGLDGRPWFKHVVFAPGLWTGYTGASFPGLVEAVDAHDEERIAAWSRTIEDKVKAATDFLS